jgi:flagellin-like protein
MGPKKGISPIIASVLLIVVVLGIGTVVTGIARNYVTTGKQEIEKAKADVMCSTDLELEVPEVNDEYKVCKVTTGSPYLLNITVTNTGTVRVDDIQVKVFGDNGFVANDSVLPDGLARGATVAISVEYDETDIGNLQQINIVPRMKKAGQIEKLYCLSSQIVLADLQECS